MAERLEDYDFDGEAMARRTQNLPKYPYDEWLDGRPWKIRQGEDFTVSVRSMMRNIQNYARENKLGRIRTSIPADQGNPNEAKEFVFQLIRSEYKGRDEQ